MLPAENAERGLDTGLARLHRVEKDFPAVGSRQIDGDAARSDEHEALGLVSGPKQDRALGQVHGLELRETIAAVGIERAGDVGQTGMHWLDPALRMAWSRHCRARLSAWKPALRTIPILPVSASRQATGNTGPHTRQPCRLRRQAICAILVARRAT